MTSKNFLLPIFTILSQHQQITQAKLRLVLNVKRQTLQYHVKRMIKENWISTSKLNHYNVISLTNFGKEQLSKIFTQNQSSTHTSKNPLLINMRCENHQIQFNCFEINADWLARHAQIEQLGTSKYFVLKDNPFRCTLRLWPDNGTLIIHLVTERISPSVVSLTELNKKKTMLIYEIVEWLRLKKIAVVDFSTLKDNGLEIESQTIDALDNITAKQIKVVEKFNRKAQGFYSELKNNSKAWIDKSYDRLEIGTNDIEYERKLLLLPENIDMIKDVLPSLKESIDLEIKNKKMHLKVLNEMNETLKLIKEKL